MRLTTTRLRSSLISIQPKQSMQINPAPVHEEEGIPSYLNRLTQEPLLSAESEIVLTRAIQNGDQAARRRLIESNMRLVINIAKGYKCRHIPMEDLIQEGAIGLMQATERFDPDRGFRFSTYATHWIRQSIGRAIDNKSKAIRLPAHVSQTIRRVEKERAKFLRETGHEPTLQELSELIGISVVKLQQNMSVGQEMLSLDLPIGDGGGTLGGMIRDETTINPEERAMRESILSELRNVVSELSEREQQVMEFRLRGDGVEVQPEEIAQALNLTRDRVRQIEVQAIRKLRIIAQQRRLRELL